MIVYANFVKGFITMRLIYKIILAVVLIFTHNSVASQNIFRFEHMGSEEGLSQNTGFSILFDSKGFMWIGTMNGLNRYDGYEFKIFRSSPENPTNFTNNRVIKLWEDRRGFIWLETYDGYYHFFNPETEMFSSIPFYEGNEIRDGAMHIFLQYSDDKIFLGSSVSGLFYLEYDPSVNTYNVRHFLNNTKNPITDNNIRFIYSDSSDNLWIGTKKGISFIAREEINKSDLVFKNQFINTSFTSVCETRDEIWFGTEDNGILVNNKTSGISREITTKNTSELKSDRITQLYLTKSGQVIAGFEGDGVMISDTARTRWKQIKFHGRNLSSIYADRYNQIWLTAVEFGVTRFDLINQQSKYYILTPQEIKPLTDLERPQFYEDSQNNLWIGLHGSGLALYNRKKDLFEFFRNDPKDPNTISSNIVHCITEDKAGQLWLGTGQVLGGIEKVIPRNSAFEHYVLEKERVDLLDNVARAIHEDQNNYLWVATKAGKLHLFDSSLNQLKVFLTLPGLGHESYRNITYSIFNDNNGYLWIGSKGYGLSVTTKPLNNTSDNYGDIRFRRFEFSESDSLSLGNNNIYSICQDKMNNIWIGTYGNGINLIKNPYEKDLKFTRINQQNSNLSSNLIRHLIIDSSGNLWVATTFGLNLLERGNIESGNYHFRIFLRNPLNDKSLIYNDVIHMFEDSGGKLWFGTFGGGVDLLEELDGQNASFKHYKPETRPGYGIIFGILEDNESNIWLSTESGLIRLNPQNGNIEIYNSFNGLGFNNFSENTCFRRKDGSLIFGGYPGFEVVRPENLLPNEIETHIELTKFLLFNKEVPINQKNSPLKKSISFSDEISLRYFQSSFSIDYSALDFFETDKSQYSYKLDNFEETWNNVGNQHRATYTNLSPGKYIFRVKLVQQDGKPESHERVLNILIAPPWWKTIPAYLFYAAIILLIIILTYKALTRINRYKNALAIEKKVNELKLQFFTNISHEIRTPLTLIMGPLEDMLADRDISHMKRLQMEIMLKNVKRMLHLTNQLLDFRKVQNNKMILKVREIDLVTFTREIFESFCPLAKHKGITYTFISRFDTFKIFADPHKLDTIIYNIISNAIKFTDTGKRVSVSIEETEKHNSVDISVTDEGPGIPQKNLGDIFTRYTVLSTQELAGTGIGLSLAYELARLHKGDILISSTVGKGSTFTIRLLKGNSQFPAAENTEYGESNSTDDGFVHIGEIYDHPEEEDDQLVAESSGKYMALIVEDNHEILNYICQSLKSILTCIGAKNGEEGLHLAKTMNPDVIITDIKMPMMDGIEMTRLLKGDFTTSHIPIIMVTSKTDLRDQITGIETGAEAYIVKPFNMEYLKSVASNLINQRAKVLKFFLYDKAGESDTLKINSKDSEFLRNIISFVEENYTGDIAINDLAEHCNISRTVMYNKIKGLTGSSPIDFIRKKKMNIAVRFLENGYNVSEAAYKTGFSDVKYFSRLFKIQFGYSPSKHKSDTAIPLS